MTANDLAGFDFLTRLLLGIVLSIFVTRLAGVLRREK